MIGTEIEGRYRIEEEIGSGGSGTVYRAVRVADGLPVVIKVLRAEVGPEQRLRFEREIRALGQSSHANIVGIVDSGVFEGTPYLVMEFAPGETLAVRLARGPLPLDEAHAVLSQLLSALAYIHERGLVHRDVKPANVLVAGGATGTLRVLLLDFGLARFLAPEAADGLVTRAGQPFGTPAYMAPEQVAGEEADARTDVYAAGLVFFEMLAGRAAFRDASSSEVLRQQVVEDLPLHEIPSQVALPWVVDVLGRSTAKSRKDRFADGGEMLRAVAGLDGANPVRDGSGSLPARGEHEAGPGEGATETSVLSPMLVKGITALALVVSGTAFAGAVATAYVFASPGRADERAWMEARLGLAPSLVPAVASASASRPPPPAPVPPPSVSASAEPPPHVATAPAPAAAPIVVSPARNPWVTVPPDLARFVAKVTRGRSLDKGEIAKVHG